MDARGRTGTRARPCPCREPAPSGDSRGRSASPRPAGGRAPRPRRGRQARAGRRRGGAPARRAVARAPQRQQAGADLGWPAVACRSPGPGTLVRPAEHYVPRPRRAGDPAELLARAGRSAPRSARRPARSSGSVRGTGEAENWSRVAVIRRSGPAGSSPRRSGCRPSRRCGPSPCSAPLTSRSRSRPRPARRRRCSRSSSRSARSPSPSPSP